MSEQMSFLQQMASDDEVLGVAMIVVLGLAGILTGLILGITRLAMRHRERMSMIDQGMHPDHPPDEVKENAPPPANP
jgi:hypothetical protein